VSSALDIYAWLVNRRKLYSFELSDTPEQNL
jgi:hypothetical protein